MKPKLLILMQYILVTALKKATREQKLALELSAAKKERDFYLSRVDQSRALDAIEERLKKVHCLYTTTKNYVKKVFFF